MKLVPLPLPGLLRVEPNVIRDARGYFLESWRKDKLPDADFVQDNHSRSVKDTVRGLHFQRATARGPGQSKLVRVVSGRIFDVAVDIRPGSPTFGKWHAEVLDAEAHAELFIPIGFAHGFCVLSDIADVLYKVTSFYDAEAESGFAFDDPAIGVAWPVGRAQALLSKRDIEARPFAEVVKVR